MTEPEYRQDDRRDVGYCPRCGTQLSALTTDARGWCDTHGWQWADWEPRQPTTSVMTGEENDRP